MIRFIITFLAVNSIKGKANAKEVVKEGMDVILKIREVAGDKILTNADKDAVVKEIQEFSTAAIKLVDEIKIPE